MGNRPRDILKTKSSKNPFPDLIRVVRKESKKGGLCRPLGTVMLASNSKNRVNAVAGGRP